MKKRKKSKWKVDKILRWMEFCGFILVPIDFILLKEGKETLLFIFFFVESLMIIPNYWKGVIEKFRADDEWAVYWVVQFLAFPIVVMWCIIFFIEKIIHG
jgi:hypothetical protein